MNRKKIEIFLDVGILLTGFLLLLTVLTGGLQFNIGDKIIGLRSLRNPLLLFLVFFSIRTLMYGKPFSHMQWKMEGARSIWTITSILSSLIIIYLVSVNFLAATQSNDEQIINLAHAQDISPVSSVKIHNGKIRLKYQNEYLAEFHIPVGDTSKYSKIRFSFSKEKGIQSLTILNVIYEQSDGASIKGLSIVRFVKGVFVYDLPLVSEEFDTIKVIIKSNLGTVNADILKVSLHSPDPFDYRNFTSAVAVIIALFLLFPGLLIVSALTSRKPSVTVLLYSLFAASLCYYLVLYLLLELSLLLQFPEPGKLLLIVLMLLIAGLVYLNYRVDRFNTLNQYIYSARIPFFIFILVLLLLTAYISFDTLYPFQNIGWKSISGPKTFDVFNAHDIYFQYANGRVIAENLPFSAEYGTGNRPLVYMPEDREMLAGVIYAVFRSMGSVVSPVVGNAFMTYTILGVAMNLMVIFPVIALTRRYVDIKSEIILIVLLFGNAVFIVQSSMTWFKFCGAALFLSALLVLLRDRQKLTSWLLAGFLFGLGANMHAAIAIGIPLYFLWFVYQWGKEAHYRPVKWLSGPLSLVGLFMLANLPWKLIKKFYLSDSIGLFTGFFFSGYQVNNSLLDSAALFFSKIPLNEQISFRLNNLIQTFRVEELLKLPGMLQKSSIDNFLLQWTQYEVGYTVFLYYPLLVLLLMCFVASRLRLQLPATVITGSGFEDKGRNSELKTLILLGIATQLVFITSAFSYSHPPDVSWVQPYGVTIMVYLGLVLIVIQNRILAGLLTAYLLLAYTRLYLAYQVIPLPG